MGGGYGGRKIALSLRETSKAHECRNARIKELGSENSEGESKRRKE